MITADMIDTTKSYKLVDQANGNKVIMAGSYRECQVKFTEMYLAGQWNMAIMEYVETAKI